MTFWKRQNYGDGIFCSFGRNLLVNAGDIRDVGSILGWEDALEEEMATHSSIIVWRIPWTNEPGRLQYTGLQRVRHDWSDLAGTQGNSNNDKSKWFPGIIGEGRMNRQGTEDFQGSETAPYDTVKADACNYTFVQGHRPCTLRWTSPSSMDFEWRRRVNAGS